jgi:hypothetical protein
MDLNVPEIDCLRPASHRHQGRTGKTSYTIHAPLARHCPPKIIPNRFIQLIDVGTIHKHRRWPFPANTISNEVMAGHLTMSVREVLNPNQHAGKLPKIFSNLLQFCSIGLVLPSPS